MSVPVTRSDAAETCLYERAAYLGSDGLADFYRCDTCLSVLVKQGWRFWTLRTFLSP